LTRDAIAGRRDLDSLDESGFAPTLPTSYTWARAGTRASVPYEAPQGRRVNVIGALAPAGPQPRLVWASRRSGQGRLDSAAFLDFVSRDLAGLPAPPDALPPTYARRRPCTIVLDNSSVHRSLAVKAGTPALARADVHFYFLPAYSPELSKLEPLWRHIKYGDLATRSFATGDALHTAVDDALAARAADLQNAMHNLPRAA
jgi:DDE superfamily endonuclease